MKKETKPFSRIAWSVSVVYMGVAAYVAWRGGTFTSRSVTMGFVSHGGMWGDLLILPVVNGLIVPHLPRFNRRRIAMGIGLVACAVFATVVAHQQWAAMGKAAGTTDFIFPNHVTGIWYSDISVSGYLHLAYMSVELSLVLAYALMPVPRRTVITISSLLMIHLIIGQVEPGWYTSGTIWTARTVIPTTASVLLTWLIGLYKIRRVSGNPGHEISEARQPSSNC